MDFCEGLFIVIQILFAILKANDVLSLYFIDKEGYSNMTLSQLSCINS